MAHLLISAAHKSSGKTTLSLGITAAFRDQQISIQTFKKGPDYIDPMWLAQASGRPCYNLDFFTMSPNEIKALFSRHMQQVPLGLIEGNKGLYDGLNLDGSNSNAALAHLLNAPVVLVLDARGMTRGIAPLVLGYKNFDPALKIKGVILNQIGGSRHESKLRAILEHYTDVTVLGAVHHDPALTIDERHLGLIPSNESRETQRKILQLAKAVKQQVDLHRLLDISNSAPLPRPPALQSEIISSELIPSELRVRIGIARDSAIGFYYPDDLDTLRSAGAELVPFSLIDDPKLPAVDGLFIGGGFPETHLEKLSANISLREEIKHAIHCGLPVYAECGGLMYLAQRIVWGQQSAEMVGVIPGDIVMHKKPQGRGYVTLQERKEHLWPKLTGTEITNTIPAHEFHYSSLENMTMPQVFAYDVVRGAGINQKNDGLIIHNMLANYSHFRHVNANPWAKRFVHFVRTIRLQRKISP